MYEPVFYRKYEEHCGILRIFDETRYMYDQNESIKLCMDSIQEKLQHYSNESDIEPLYPSIIEVEACLHKLDMPIEAYVYDNYCKVIYIQTIDKVFIPIILVV